MVVEMIDKDRIACSANGALSANVDGLATLREAYLTLLDGITER